MPTRVPKTLLQTASLTPATFQAAVFTPQKEDMSLLQRSMATLDERKENTDKQRAAIRAALGQVKLNAAEDEWKNNYINRISQKIDNAAQFGDYSTALEVATNLAAEATTSPELLGRVRANEQYEKEVQTQQARRDKGEISQATYKWWMKNNPYTYTDTYDNNGNIVGGSVYEPEFRPVNDINWASTAMAAFKLITPYKRTTATDGSTSVTNNTGESLTRGGKSYQSGESISTSGHSSQSQEKITKEQIIGSIEELLKATPDGYKQAEQAYDVALDEFNDLVEQYNNAIRQDPNSNQAKILGQKLDARKQLMYRNGSPIDYKEYYARMVTDNLFAQNLAYDWRTTSSGGSNAYSLSDSGNGGGRRHGIGLTGGYDYSRPQPYGSVSWYAPHTRQQTNTNLSQQQVAVSASNIVTSFEQQNNKKK